MGFCYAVKGWIEAIWPEQFRQVKDLIEERDDTGYNRHWMFPSSPEGCCPRYVFYGGDVKDLSLDDVRDVIRTIAETVRSLDGDIVDYTEGYFHADAEDGSVLLRWECRDGHFYETRRESRSGTCAEEAG